MRCLDRWSAATPASGRLAPGVFPILGRIARTSRPVGLAARQPSRFPWSLCIAVAAWRGRLIAPRPNSSSQGPHEEACSHRPWTKTTRVLALVIIVCLSWCGPGCRDHRAHARRAAASVTWRAQPRFPRRRYERCSCRCGEAEDTSPAGAPTRGTGCAEHRLAGDGGRLAGGAGGFDDDLGDDAGVRDQGQVAGVDRGDVGLGALGHGLQQSGRDDLVGGADHGP